MIVVRVELHSAKTGYVTEIARMHVANDGTWNTPTRGSYDATTFRGRTRLQLAGGLKPQRKARVENYPRKRLHVWNLVAKALKAMKYDEA